VRVDALADIADALKLPLPLALVVVGSIVWIYAELRAPSLRGAGVKLTFSGPAAFLVLAPVGWIARSPLGSDTPIVLTLLSAALIVLGISMLVWIARSRPKADIDR